VTGKGADVLIIDDPHSEQEAAMAASNPDVYDKVIEWYTSGPRQRLQPGGAIVIADDSLVSKRFDWPSVESCGATLGRGLGGDRVPCDTALG
jgi:hypothetical protein